MPIIPNLMGSGVPGQEATYIGTETFDSVPAQSVAITLTATGTVLADALQLTALNNILTTVAASTGVKLPVMGTDALGAPVYIKNAGANTVNIFPESATVGINRGTLGAAITLAAGSSATLRKTTATNWES